MLVVKMRYALQQSLEFYFECASGYRRKLASQTTEKEIWKRSCINNQDDTVPNEDMDQAIYNLPLHHISVSVHGIMDLRLPSEFLREK